VRETLSSCSQGSGRSEKPKGLLLSHYDYEDTQDRNQKISCLSRLDFFNMSCLANASVLSVTESPYAGNTKLLLFNNLHVLGF